MTFDDFAVYTHILFMKLASKKNSYFYEIPLSLAVLIFINWKFTPEIPGFLGLNPHPYWLVILLFGFRYGLVAGMLSGVGAASVYLAFVWLFGEPYLFEDFTFYMLPSFFVLAGGLIGLGSHRYQVITFHLEQEKAHLENEAKRLKQEIDALNEINAGLEKRIVTRMSTLITVYEGARKLESMDISELYPAILDFIVKTLEATEASLYVKHEQGWKLKCQHGFKDYQKLKEILQKNEGITGLAGFRNQVLTIRDLMGEAEKGNPSTDVLGDALLAGPLCKGEKGEVMGIVAIGHLPFLKFNSATVNLFAFILQWASRSLGRTVYIHELRASEVIDPEYQVYSYPYFQSRFAQEFLRSKTYYLPMTVGLLKIEGLNELPVQKRNHYLTIMSQLLKESVRDMDVVARFQDPLIPFAFLLLTASSNQAEVFGGKIREKIALLGLAGSTEGELLDIRVGMASFTPKMEAPDGLIDIAKKNLNEKRQAA